MIWYKYLYMGDSVRGKVLYYKYLLRYTKRLTGTYCILPAAHEQDLFDICRSELLRVRQFYPQDQLVLGLAGSRREACLLAGDMVMDAMAQVPGGDLEGLARVIHSWK